MEKAEIKERDKKLDIIRGCAALIVVIGHVLQRFDGVEENLLFNVIFSLQMPIFMMISGYSRNYSVDIDNIKVFWKHIRKRMVSVLLPWFTWSLTSCILLWQKSILEYIRTAAFQMEMAFWFLFSLFTIDFIFSIAEVLSARISNYYKRLIWQLILYWGGITAIFLVGKIVGITFLGIKYSVYYSIYYMVGFLLFKIAREEKYRNVFGIREFLSVACISVYCYLISRHNVFLMPDSSWYIIVRIMISLTGSLVVFMIIDRIKCTEGIIQKILIIVGNYSLELYVVHFFIVRFIECDFFNINRIDGLFFAIIYSFIVVGLSYMIIFVLNQFRFMKLILFGKK